MPDTVKETLKELLRVLLLASISYLLINNEVVGNLLFQWMQGYFSEGFAWFLIGILFAILRAVDKFLHELGKKNNNELLVRGLTRF